MEHKVKQDLVLAVPPQRAWEAVKDFQNTNWLAGATQAKEKLAGGVKPKRSMTLDNGKEYEEELVEAVEGEKEKILTWTIVRTSLPIANWKGKLSVTPVGRSRSRLTFECSFQSNDSNMKQLFQHLYEEGLSQIKIILEG